MKASYETWDEKLIAFQETLKQHGVKIKKPELLRRALTHKSYLGDGHEESSSNEELEFLGDAVLGFIVSKQLFKPGVRTGGALTKKRSYLVRNEKLAELATGL